jgi:hypothetical protein
LSSGSDHGRPREIDGGLQLVVDGVLAAAVWRRRERWDLDLALVGPLPPFTFGTHIPQASRRNRSYLDVDARLSDLALTRLAETMTVAVRVARLVESDADALREAYRRIGRELAAQRRRVVSSEARDAALAALAAKPPAGRFGRWRDGLRRTRIEDRHARWHALLREVDWNFAEHVAARLGVHPPGGVLAQLRQALSLHPEEVTR